MELKRLKKTWDIKSKLLKDKIILKNLWQYKIIKKFIIIFSLKKLANKLDLMFADKVILRLTNYS